MILRIRFTSQLWCGMHSHFTISIDLHSIAPMRLSICSDLNPLERILGKGRGKNRPNICEESVAHPCRNNKRDDHSAPTWQKHALWIKQISVIRSGDYDLPDGVMSPLSSTNLALKKSCMICEASRSVYIIALFRIPVSWPGFPQELPSVLLFPRLPSPPAPFEIPSYLSTTVFGIDTIQTFQGHQYIPPTSSPVLRVGARTYLQCWQCLWPPKLSHRASMTRCAVLQLSVLGRGLGRAVWRLLHPASKPRIEEMTLEPFVLTDQYLQNYCSKDLDLAIHLHCPTQTFWCAEKIFSEYANSEKILPVENLQSKIEERNKNSNDSQHELSWIRSQTSLGTWTREQQVC